MNSFSSRQVTPANEIAQIEHRLRRLIFPLVGAPEEEWKVWGEESARLVIRLSELLGESTPQEETSLLIERMNQHFTSNARSNWGAWLDEVFPGLREKLPTASPQPSRAKDLGATTSFSRNATPPSTSRQSSRTQQSVPTRLETFAPPGIRLHSPPTSPTLSFPITKIGPPRKKRKSKYEGGETDAREPKPQLEDETDGGNANDEGGAPTQNHIPRVSPRKRKPSQKAASNAEGKQPDPPKNTHSNHPARASRSIRLEEPVSAEEHTPPLSPVASTSTAREILIGRSNVNMYKTLVGYLDTVIERVEKQFADVLGGEAGASVDN